MSNEPEKKSEETAETLKRLEQLDALGPGKDTRGDLLRKGLKNIGKVVSQSLEKELKKEDEEEKAGEEDTLSRLEKDINAIHQDWKLRASRKTSMVIRVTVTNGQARVNLPKNVALKLNLLKEDGEPGEARHLQLSMDWSPGIETQPWIVLTPVRVIEEGPPVVPEGPESKPPLSDPKVPLRWG